MYWLDDYPSYNEVVDDTYSYALQEVVNIDLIFFSYDYQTLFDSVHLRTG